MQIYNFVFVKYLELSGLTWDEVADKVGLSNSRIGSWRTRDYPNKSISFDLHKYITSVINEKFNSDEIKQHEVRILEDISLQLPFDLDRVKEYLDNKPANLLTYFFENRYPYSNNYSPFKLRNLLNQLNSIDVDNPEKISTNNSILNRIRRTAEDENLVFIEILTRRKLAMNMRTSYFLSDDLNDIDKGKRHISKAIKKAKQFHTLFLSDLYKDQASLFITICHNGNFTKNINKSMELLNMSEQELTDLHPKYAYSHIRHNLAMCYVLKGEMYDSVYNNNTAISILEALITKGYTKLDNPISRKIVFLWYTAKLGLARVTKSIVGLDDVLNGCKKYISDRSFEKNPRLLAYIYGNLANGLALKGSIIRDESLINEAYSYASLCVELLTSIGEQASALQNQYIQALILHEKYLISMDLNTIKSAHSLMKKTESESQNLNAGFGFIESGLNTIEFTLAKYRESLTELNKVLSYRLKKYSSLSETCTLLKAQDAMEISEIYYEIFLQTNNPSDVKTGLEFNHVAETYFKAHSYPYINKRVLLYKFKLYHELNKNELTIWPDNIIKRELESMKISLVGKNQSTLINEISTFEAYINESTFTA